MHDTRTVLDAGGPTAEDSAQIFRPIRTGLLETLERVAWEAGNVVAISRNDVPLSFGGPVGYNDNMVLKLLLSPELEDRLCQEAERRGVSPDAVTIELLENHLPCGNPIGASEIRRHDALLNSYGPQDEGLYDDLAR